MKFVYKAGKVVDMKFVDKAGKDWNLKDELKNIYRAKDCCDTDDCDRAMVSLNELVMSKEYYRSPAICRRMYAVGMRRKKLVAAGKIGLGIS